MKRRSLIRRLIPWIIAAVLISALVVFVGIPLYSQKEETTADPPRISYFEEDPGKLVMENDALSFVMDTATTQFILTEKETGRVWRSNPADAEKDPIAKTTYKDALSSTLAVTYTTSGGEVTMNNYTYAIKNQTYQVTQRDDGSIRVDYSVGQIDRIYRIPLAITAERYKLFTENMSKSTVKKLASNYTLVDPAKLDSRDNKDELIAQYPSVTEQALYILRADTNATNKEKIEGYFAEGGYTEEDFEKDMELVAHKNENAGPIFNVTMIYRLDGRDLLVEVPYSEIRYRADYPITYVTPLPMFGAAGTDAEGYMFIPEGGGAIIRYNNGKLSQSAYYANLYGWDYGVERKEAVSETRNAFPVFGATQSEGAFICIIEGARSYAGISADISGRYNSYNTISAKYNVLHAAQFNVSNKTAKLVYIYEAEVPEDTIVQRYRFVNSTNYTDLANAYGDYLRASVPNLADAQVSEKFPVNVELIGAINKKVVKFGVPVDSVVATTTFDQARKILDELSGSGIEDLSVRMTGWANGGVRQKVLTGVHVLNELGGANGLKSLTAEAKNRNVNLYLDGITCFAYNSGLFDGFIPFSNAARFATREQVRLYPYNIVTYQKAEYLDDFYLTRPSYAAKNASNLIGALKGYSSSGVAFRDIGGLLSADYYPRDLVTREQVMQMNIDTMKEARAAGLKVMIKEGNDYAIPYADMITDMNLTGQAYAIIDERIPFYQIALHGIRDYTGQAINLSGDYQTLLLECAEYGAGLNFTFMAENTRVLQDSRYSCYTSSGYSYWKEQVIPMILRYQEEMGGLNRIRIADHHRLAEEVTVTVYEDGTQVFVNYSGEDFLWGEVRVPARDYLIVRGGDR
ncbi:MAG: hypothetical protein IKP22_03370 [Clostridia bacterium]|nr:hypothetical protein [Clostridia bacterium]